MTEQMDTAIQVGIRSLSDTDERILQMPEVQQGGMAEKDGILYLRSDDLIYSCKDTPAGKKLLEKISSEKTRITEKNTEEKAWMDLLSGNTDLSVLGKYGIREYEPRCVILFRPCRRSRARPRSCGGPCS